MCANEVKLAVIASQWWNMKGNTYDQPMGFIGFDLLLITWQNGEARIECVHLNVSDLFSDEPYVLQ